MCGNPFKSPSAPKIEQVAPAPTPAPTPVASQDVDTVTDDAAKQKRRKGYAATRVAEDRNVLTDSGKRTTLG